MRPPGRPGQIVPTSTQEDELCINGMSFSARGSKWANAALVVAVETDNLHKLAEGWEALEVPPGHEALIGASPIRTRIYRLDRVY